MGYIPKHSQAPLPHPVGCLCSSPGLTQLVQGSDLARMPALRAGWHWNREGQIPPGSTGKPREAHVELREVFLYRQGSVCVLLTAPAALPALGPWSCAGSEGHPRTSSCYTPLHAAFQRLLLCLHMRKIYSSASLRVSNNFWLGENRIWL